jgi:hypothetical protein
MQNVREMMKRTRQKQGKSLAEEGPETGKTALLVLFLL